MTDRLAYLLIAVGLALMLSACAPFRDALAIAAQGSQVLGSVLDVAQTGSSLFFARHPAHPDRGAVDVALHRARLAQTALDSALRASEAIDSGDLRAAREAAGEAYGDLRALLQAIGVLDGVCVDCGGVESDAPVPMPFVLPSKTAVEAML